MANFLEITTEQFNAEMQRIYSTFGDNAYKPERIREIWYVCKKLPHHSVSRIVTHFIRSSRYAPLPQNFYEASKAERKYLQERQNKQRDPIELAAKNSREGLRKYLMVVGASSIDEALALEKKYIACEMPEETQKRLCQIAAEMEHVA